MAEDQVWEWRDEGLSGYQAEAISAYISNHNELESLLSGVSRAGRAATV